jgi:hypothetical protein
MRGSVEGKGDDLKCRLNAELGYITGNILGIFLPLLLARLYLSEDTYFFHQLNVSKFVLSVEQGVKRSPTIKEKL